MVSITARYRYFPLIFISDVDPVIFMHDPIVLIFQHVRIGVICIKRKVNHGLMKTNLSLLPYNFLVQQKHDPSLLSSGPGILSSENIFHEASSFCAG